MLSDNGLRAWRFDQRRVIVAAATPEAAARAADDVCGYVEGHPFLGADPTRELSDVELDGRRPLDGWAPEAGRARPGDDQTFTVRAHLAVALPGDVLAQWEPTPVERPSDGTNADNGLRAWLFAGRQTVIAAATADDAARAMDAIASLDALDDADPPLEMTAAELDERHQALDDDERPIAGATCSLREALASAKPGDVLSSWE